MNRKAEEAAVTTLSLGSSVAPVMSNVAVVTLGVVALAGIAVVCLRGGQLGIGSAGLTLAVPAPV